MIEPLFLSPSFQPKIWGGRKLETVFNYQIPAGKIGEAWAISAHPHGPSKIQNGPLAGEELNEAFKLHPEYFGNPKEKVFPLLTKILDADASLSVQVHPDDEYAEVHEHELGKTECWYVIQADPDSYLIYGHHAKNRQELAEMINKGEWDQLLRKYPVKTGDFIYVPSGTIHALNKGIMVLETQQSSDTTYRLYDYDRVDEKTGEKRELHLQQSIDVTTVPNVDPKLNVKEQQRGASTFTTYIEAPISPFFSVWQWRIKDRQKLTHQRAPYTLASVIEGKGSLSVDGKDYPIQKGVHFIIPAQVSTWELAGDLQIIASEPNNK
ncbi:mannose-6-phosphate isomerase, class I [Xylocopilactobacillus apicola]|uniref:Mannose-6-phosphate isomerase n=1 Tax=Xylocopilactobacillus apicola TaxID=2932184 RepID=A0AAU9DAA4_9LACO|nr:mannose-6-phosphate isomerase, class I [Xylocopilactobacillus apicola]BDR59315.1 mannose-6-phosphate isomerase [Xylocopilactobacillus apicola]